MSTQTHPVSWWRQSKSARQAPHARLAVEELEGRRLPSITPVATPPADPHAADLKTDIAAVAAVEVRLDHVQADIKHDTKAIVRDNHDLKVDTAKVTRIEANLDKVQADITKDLNADPVDLKDLKADVEKAVDLEGKLDVAQREVARDKYDLKRDTAALEADKDHAAGLKTFLGAINDDIAADKKGGDDSATDAALAAIVKARIDAAHDDITADETEVDQDAASLKADQDKVKDLESQVDAAWKEVKSDLDSGNLKDLLADIEKAHDLQGQLTTARCDAANDKRDLTRDTNDLKADQALAGWLETYLDTIQADIAAS